MMKVDASAAVSRLPDNWTEEDRTKAIEDLDKVRAILNMRLDWATIRRQTDNKLDFRNVHDTLSGIIRELRDYKRPEPKFKVGGVVTCNCGRVRPGIVVDVQSGPSVRYRVLTADGPHTVDKTWFQETDLAPYTPPASTKFELCPTLGSIVELLEKHEGQPAGTRGVIVDYRGPNAAAIHTIYIHEGPNAGQMVTAYARRFTVVG